MGIPDKKYQGIFELAGVTGTMVVSRNQPIIHWILFIIVYRKENINKFLRKFLQNSIKRTLNC